MTDELETLIVEREKGVVRVVLNRPEKRNAVDNVMWRELTDTLQEVADRPEDRVLVLTGAGEGFCSGADRTSKEGRPSDTASTLELLRYVGRCALRLHELTKPTIAAVNGAAVGAGCNLALGCDIIVASNRARFGEIFIQRELCIDFGGSWLLPRLVGLHKAKELALFGDIIDAAEAERIGLVNRVVAHGELGSTVGEMADRLASFSPLATSITKRLLNQSFSASMASALEAESVGSTFCSQARQDGRGRRNPPNRSDRQGGGLPYP